MVVFHLNRHIRVPVTGGIGTGTSFAGKAVSLPQYAGTFRLFTMPGNSARVVETEVTSRLEGILSRVNGIKSITSTSDNGSGYIQISLDKHADIDATRFEVSTLVRQLWPQLPDGVSYPLISTQRSDDNASRPFMTYTLNAPATPIVIQRYGEEHIKPQLAALNGIYKVELSGATPMEWRIVYDNVQLERIGVGVQDILTAISERYGREFLGICELETAGKQSGSDWFVLRKETRRDLFHLRFM